MPTLPTPVVTITPDRPLPIEQFDNHRLREAVLRAVEGVEQGHGNAVLNIDNKGFGSMVVQRFRDKGRLKWAAVAATRFTFEDRDLEVQATLTGSW